MVCPIVAPWYALLLLHDMPYCCLWYAPWYALLLLYSMLHYYSIVCPIVAYSMVYAVYGPITYTIIALLYPYLWSYYESTVHRSINL